MTALLTAQHSALLDLVADSAEEVDANRRPALAHLPALAEAGVLDLGIDELLAGDAHDVRPAAEAIAAVAEQCLPTAFGLWAHRMTIDYLARGSRSPRSEQVLADLRAGRIAGITAMASGLKDLAGLGGLGTTAHRTEDGWVVDGFVPWASNLVDGAVMVLPARAEDGSTLVAWLPLDAPGVEAQHIAGLLALDATASGTLRFSGVRIAEDQVLSHDLAGFARSFRPTFLVLQVAFCVGLVRRSLAECHQGVQRGDNAVFCDELAQLSGEVEGLLDIWQRLASDTDHAGLQELLQLRLDASRLAGRVTRLEATLAGGRGFQLDQGASRRFREAAFLPVQSPSEGQLRRELAQFR